MSHKTLQKHPPSKLEEKRGILEEQPQRNTTEKLDGSNVPTTPARRRLAWDAESTSEDIQKQPSEEEEEEKPGRDKQVYVGEPENLDEHEKPKADSMKEG
jgi:protein MDM1